jgi:hypothetical protein
MRADDRERKRRSAARRQPQHGRVSLILAQTAQAKRDLARLDALGAAFAARYGTAGE